MEPENRRSFLKQAAVAPALLSFGNRVMGANERINLALIGGRNQGKGVALRSIQQGAVIKTFCDVDDAILGQVSPELEKAQGRKPEHVKDFRKVLEDKDIDGVIIAAPDHWHTHMTLLACQAGKDCYTEKPLSQTIEEGHLIREAARKYKRIVQVGTHRRSIEHFRSAAEYAASGKLGKVCRIKAWITQLRASIGNPPNGQAPMGADYDMWLGPAPQRPFNANRFHYNWRFFWDYGNSELGNQGVHVLDVALMAIEKMRGEKGAFPTRVSSSAGIYWLDDAKEVPDTQIVTYDFKDLMLIFELQSFANYRRPDGAWAGTAFYGTEGELVVDEKGWKVYRKDGTVDPVVKATGGSHERNFLDCVKSRQTPNADVEIGRRSTTLCHLGNISHHLRRDVVFDPATETFRGDKEANARLTKEYRAAYPRPKV